MGACISRENVKTLQPARREQRTYPTDDARHIVNLKPSSVKSRKNIENNDYGF
jgi:hypothetical protein